MNIHTEKLEVEAERSASETAVSTNPLTGEVFMSHVEAHEKIRFLYEKEMVLWENGQAEYARDPANVFGNFVRLGQMLGLRPEEILLVYAVKHLDGIISWINGYKSQREDVRGRINDLRVYLAILYLMVEAYESVADSS